MNNYETVIVDDCFYKEKILGQNFVELLSLNFGDVQIVNNEKEIENQDAKKEYFIVLYSSYPLLKFDDIMYIIDYSINKNLSICKFNGGFFIKKDYFFEKNINFCSSELQFDYSFKIADSLTLNRAKDALRLRIIEKHLKNGVRFNNINNAIIDGTVKIGDNVVIGNGCEIYGDSIIKCNCEILHNCYLENVVVESDCKLFNCNIKNYKVKKKSNLNTFNNFSF